MEFFNLFAILTTLAAVFGYVNHRWIGLPTTIGQMVVALFLSLGVLGLGVIEAGPARALTELLEALDFDATLLQGLLGFLLFAGALHVNLDDLIEQRFVVGGLATIGVLLSTLLVGSLVWLVFGWLGAPVSLIYCLVFGALISPTDPVAVMAILKQTGVPRSLETKITGESLFNDGVGLVVFLVLAGIATGGDDVGAGTVLELFLQEALGGVALGLVLGSAAYWMLKSIDAYALEVLITLALVSGGYALAHALHTSGPLAMVVAGLLIGNHGRRLAMSRTTRAHLDTFWELVDEVLNAVLFVMMGLEVLGVTLSGRWLSAGLLAIPIVLLARAVSVVGAMAALRRRRSFSPHAGKIMIWGGLRGGISIALALSLPPVPERAELVTATYVVVCFSIFVQGLTIGPLVKRLYGREWA